MTALESGPQCHYTHSATAAVPAAEAFAYVTDVDHLPECIPGLVSAEPVDGAEVEVEAEVDGERFAAKAWILVDVPNRSLRWGADGPNDCHGTLTVNDAGAQECEIAVSLTTTRLDSAVQQGIETTVAKLTEAVED
ncbi:SRPBCC family protein [Actinokineospora pegani]|uniref:SRPBCC family protein n=1 Tax=Actinokineospora pegani TaxID=2654637 RepID=UPI0012EA22C2|nr:SRPBCC family protein [Actinokineospora pegani]